MNLGLALPTISYFTSRGFVNVGETEYPVFMGNVKIRAAHPPLMNILADELEFSCRPYS